MPQHLSGNITASAVLSLGVLSAINFLDSYCRYLLSVSVLPYVDYASYEYGLLSGALFGVVYALGGVGAALHPALGTHTVPALAAATVLFGAAFLGTAFSSSFAQLAVIRMVMGLGQAVVLPCSARVIGALFAPGQRGAAFGVLNMAVYAAFAVVLSLGTYMYDEFGWRAGYVLFGAIGMCVGACVPCTVQSPSGPAAAGDPARSDSRPDPDGPEEDRASFLSGFRQISDTDESAFMESVHSDSTLLWGAAPLLPSAVKSEAAGDVSGSASARAPRGYAALAALWRVWSRHPSLSLLALAMGVRLGGGYIWSAYTAVFFSELYVDNGDSCAYSHTFPDMTLGGAEGAGENIYTYSTLQGGAVCGADFPYCVAGLCSDIAQTPWHNTGMSHERLEQFMSWVPLAGSGLGSILGGFISDWSTRVRFGGAGGAGGVEADARPRIANRALLASLSCLVSGPPVLLALQAGYPNCFLWLVGSGLLGEMYIGITVTLLADLCPGKILPLCVAAFSLLTTALASMVQLLIPLLKGIFDALNDGHTFTVQAAPPEGTEGGEYTYSTHRTGSAGLQQAMLWALGAVYGCAALLYAFAFLQLRREIPDDKDYSSIHSSVDRSTSGSSGNRRSKNVSDDITTVTLNSS